MTITPRPTKIQISNMPDKPNILPPVRTGEDARQSIKLVRKLLQDIEVTNNPFWIAMPEKNLPRAGLDANASVAPNVSAAISHAADAITAEDAPVIRGILTNLIGGDRLQPEAEGTNFKASITEDVLESTPGKECGEKKHGRAHTHTNS